MEKLIVEVDPFFSKAGECFMFLLWVESTMCDLIVLKEGGKELINQYNRSYGKAAHPPDFAKKRLELKVDSFPRIIKKFWNLWPRWEETVTVRESVERVGIFRNAFGHAQVQPFRGYLLYTPTKGSWENINSYMKCGACSEYHGSCSCSKASLSEPRCLKLDTKAVNVAYEDIRTIDRDCLSPTAVDLGVEYRGIAWPNEL